MRTRVRSMVCRAMIGASIAAFLATSSATAQTGATGNWSGTYSFSVQLSGCSNKTFTANGAASMTLLQTGTSISGRMDLVDFLAFTGACTAATAEVTRTIVGTVDGSTIASSVPNNPNMPQFNGSIGAGTIALQWTDAGGGTGSLTFVRASGDAPAVDVTGAWSGNYSFTDRCSNGGTQSYAGAFTLGLTQSGTNAAGVVTMQNVPLYDQSCRKITSLDVAMATAGVVSGSTFTGAVFDPSGSFEFPIRATVGNASMSGSVVGANATNTTGTFTLTQTGTVAPGADLAGSYEGSYTERDNAAFTCLNFSSLTFSGPASLTIVQAGNAVAGWLTFHEALAISSDGFGNCIAVPIGDEVLPVYGSVASNAVKLTLPIGSGAVIVTSVTFNGDAVSGTVNDSFGDTGAFTAKRSASATPTVINSFTAAPSTVVPGQPAALSWSTTNATSVTIDNGIGAQPSSGSVTVFPTQTTVYTLTATGAAGTQTAQTTIAVVQPGPKRRAVRP